jgi:translocation and assembly module TamB
MTLRRILLLLPVMLLLLVASSWYWLLHTQSGANWAWSVATSTLNGALDAQSLSGDLSAGLTVHHLTFSNDSVDVTVSVATAAVDIDLLARSITIDPARVAGVSIALREDADSGQAASLYDVLESLQLPVELFFPGLLVDDLSVAGVVESDLLRIASATLTGRWQDDIHVDNFDIRSPLADASGDAHMMLAAPHGLEAGFAMTAHPELTGQPVPVDATVNLNSDFESVNIDADASIAAIDANATLRSAIDLRGNELSGQLRWEGFQWPLDGGIAEFESRSGTVTLAGSIDDWSVDGTLMLLLPQIPESRFTISAKGNQDAVATKIIDGNVLGGTLSGSAEYSWRSEQRFAANIVANDIRTSALLPEWPATLSGSFDVSGQRLPLKISAIVDNVHGEILDRTLSADGQMDYSDANLSFTDLRVRHGESSALLNGNLYSPDGLTYDLSVSDLGHFIPDAAGQVTANGRVSMVGEIPILRIEGSSEALSYAGVSVAELTITDHAAPGSNLDVEIIANNMALNEEVVESLRLRLYVDAEGQSASAEILTPGLHSALSVNGALENWDEPSTWTGEIARFELQFDDYSAALESPVELRLSQVRADLDRFRIAGDRDLTLSGTASWNDVDGAVVSTTLGDVPLNLVNSFVETGLTFDQTVTGEMSLQLGPAGELSGRGDIAMTPGTIIGDEGPDTFFPTGAARLGVDLDNDGLRAGVIDLPLPGQGQIAAEFEVSDAGSNRPALIDAMIDIDLADIGALARLFPLIDAATGKLRVDLEIDGPVGNPGITGDVSLQRGSLTYLPIGLALTDIDLVSELRNDGELEVTGSFRAGDGIGRIHTRAGRLRGAADGLTLSLIGDNLLLIDVPDVRAVANADVQLTLDTEALHINGALVAPSARVSPSGIGTSKVYESNDVIIVAGELPHETEAEDDVTGLQFFGNLKASLGNDVVINLGPAETNVTGSVDLTWTGDPIPMADGRLTINGEILAFGQRLEITEGLIRFPQVSVVAPNVRIRAEREIYGNTDVRRAGLLVAGSLTRPTVEPYTTPHTTEERALTLLVTGSDFNYEQGMGSVGFGTYIAPRVYASYGIGLFDTENVIRLRYELKRGFGITATSGQTHSGLDLSYRFEN